MNRAPRNFNMHISTPITFIAAVSDRKILENNLLASDCLRAPHPHQILVQEGFRSSAAAYNAGIDQSVNDLLVFSHQDIIFPQPWLGDLERSLQLLETTDPNWGVLGCYGVTGDNQPRGHIYSHGHGILQGPCDPPQTVQTLDEIVLILRKSSGLRFDDTLPDFHMYGVDICMRAAKQGRKSYAIDAFCIHNSTFNLVLPKGFYDCYRHIQQTWSEFLPIQTSCVRITRFGIPMYERRASEFYLRYFRHKKIGAVRTTDVPRLLDTVQALQKQVNLPGAG